MPATVTMCARARIQRLIMHAKGRKLNGSKSKYGSRGRSISNHEEKSLTEKQREYIEILSRYPSTKELDQADIRQYLESVGKTKVLELTKKEATEMIQILLKRPTEYTFACGKVQNLPKQEVNSYHVMGELEGCLHACPDKTVGSDVNNCPYWLRVEGHGNQNYYPLQPDKRRKK